MASVCPFASAKRANTGSFKKTEESNESQQSNAEKFKNAAKCPFGYDSVTFKLGPLSCVICQALLFESSQCRPCSHKFCRACISPFKDCPLCGADIDSVEPDIDLQKLVDQFIEGHARIKRSRPSDTKEIEEDKVLYEDVSLERGTFLVQHAMRAFKARNMESARSRLSICAEDIRELLDKDANTSELCSQLGAVLGMLGDCCRAMGDASSAVDYFEQSSEFLSKLPLEDLEVIHTLSVSLNKIGDLKYYDGNLEAAKSYYSRALGVRKAAVKDRPENVSQAIDVAISLAKVADVDRQLGNEKIAIDGFQEGIQCLEGLQIDSNDTLQVKRHTSVLQFLRGQLVCLEFS